MRLWPMRLIMLALFWTWSQVAQAQGSSTAASQQLLGAEQLDQLLAPIALYSDPLLAQVLMASTYPLEIVQADRWIKGNRNLKANSLTTALANQIWDDSVKSLVQVPTVLAMMSDKLDWTQKVGDAVLAQQADVMDSVQRLRTRSQANGKLQSGSQQTVNVQTEGQKQYILIEPASPAEIYVPYYEPAVVYGAWPYPAYPPLYFPPPPRYVAAGALANGIAFGTGVAVGHAVWGSCDWDRHNINIVANRTVNVDNFNRNTANFSKWEHNPDHRHGMRYSNDGVRQKYAKSNPQAGSDMRNAFRGRNAVIDSGQNRLEAGSREGPGAAERTSLGERDRQNEADRRSRISREGAFEPAYSGEATRAHSERGRQSYGEHRGGGRR